MSPESILSAYIVPIFDTNAPTDVCSYILHGFINTISDSTIGTGDTFHVVSPAWPPSCSLLVPPTFCGTITCISGYLSTHIKFKYRNTSTQRIHTLYVPTACARITAQDRFIGWMNFRYISVAHAIRWLHHPSTRNAVSDAGVHLRAGQEGTE
jgi:hypothetical protein